MEIWFGALTFTTTNRPWCVPHLELTSPPRTHLRKRMVAAALGRRPGTHRTDEYPGRVYTCKRDVPHLRLTYPARYISPDQNEHLQGKIHTFSLILVRLSTVPALILNLQFNPFCHRSFCSRSSAYRPLHNTKVAWLSEKRVLATPKRPLNAGASLLLLGKAGFLVGSPSENATLSPRLLRWFFT
jgi:hypothetical protein